MDTMDTYAYFFIHNHMPSALFSTRDCAESAASFLTLPITFYKITLTPTQKQFITFIGKWVD